MTDGRFTFHVSDDEIVCQPPLHFLSMLFHLPCAP